MKKNNLAAIPKITIVTGHYGAGKTNFSINYALYLNSLGKKCAVADLDIVNPYFRAADHKKMFNEKGIRLLVSPYANSNLDIPALTVSFSKVLARDEFLIIDVGGDDAGAVALGRYRDLILSQQNLDMLYVFNCYRYLTKEPLEAIALMKEIERVSGINCTGIINNSNLGRSTNGETIEQSIDYAKAIADITKLPIKYTCVDNRIEAISGVTHIFPVEIFVKSIWDK